MGPQTEAYRLAGALALGIHSGLRQRPLLACQFQDRRLLCEQRAASPHDVIKSNVPVVGATSGGSDSGRSWKGHFSRFYIAKKLKMIYSLKFDLIESAGSPFPTLEGHIHHTFLAWLVYLSQLDRANTLEDDLYGAVALAGKHQERKENLEAIHQEHAADHIEVSH